MLSKEFAGQTAIVTGASSGIGLATTAKLVAAGALVVAVGRDAAALARVAELGSAKDGGSIEPFVADLTDPAAASRIVKAAVGRFGGLDLLVNAAGIIAMGTIETTEDEDWQRMLDMNTTAPFRLMHAAVPRLLERKGSVVNVSSVNGLRSFAGVLAYNVSKSALDQLTRCAALELAPKGVRVNAVNPGVVVTNLHRRAGMDDDRYAAFLERSKETHPIGRPGQADEIADLILFLASPRAAWITGETISIDGGRHLTCAR
jgi:NAD(P)-dependent dehydrogenase (short-subunit alcohol dehydrogenase family)